jgi:hypothetical protein
VAYGLAPERAIHTLCDGLLASRAVAGYKLQVTTESVQRFDLTQIETHTM